ncbi:2-oxoglutarate dehydrogenase complex dihydrolipoyllysine-residue succinyltransferase [Paenibacillus sp. 1001270B_150601_E10]|uniref:2-oxoglutarate dehydrogenase complex dihydrolipoyllysine-residue succinyltransferase n=1 Tax=Paenibacillus sp. 1001270B_150601_E10 TaxID=2787079 RepID=UPI00189E4FE9|nr:2-oxoglutarate dehydrogenase complex dihydrolipoyllysine-residue succinyltransferase [Paenibacillus sp. 1001270B_150601_E10]
MAEIKVPDLGDSITEGTLHKWHVKQGDAVKQGDVLAELETDKVNLEIAADEDGVIEQIVRQDGDSVLVGEVIAILGAGGSSASPAPAASSEPASAEPQVAAAVEAPTKPADVTAAASAPEAVPAPDADTYATPGARRLAREQGIDLKSVQTRDPLGRVTQDDVEAQARAKAAGTSAPQAAAPAPAASAPAAKAASAADAFAGKAVDIQKMSRRRQTIAKRLVEAQQTAAMLTTFNEVDMTAIMDVRKRRKDRFKEKYEVNLGFMSFFTKAVIGALKAYPLLNAEIAGDELIVKKFYDIGIAVSAKEGLVVPVVRDADRLGFAEIEKEIVELANKARNNSLSISDLQGGTFTITNGGVFGSLLSTPILNAPQVGILGMHKIQMRPVGVDNERIELRPMMYIALSYDHRIVDGAEAVSFLVKVKELLEDPESLLLEG